MGYCFLEYFFDAILLQYGQQSSEKDIFIMRIPGPKITGFAPIPKSPRIPGKG